MGRLMVVCFAAYSFFVFCYSMKVIPERFILDTVNEEYLTDVIANVRRYSRKGGYYFNIGGNLKRIWGNNVSVDVVLYEFLHNEYKRTFVEFHFDQACRFLETDPYIGKGVRASLKEIGVTCPLPAGKILVSNITIPMESFPYVWPFERAKADITISCNHRQTLIVNGSIYVRFEQKKKYK